MNKKVFKRISIILVIVMFVNINSHSIKTINKHKKNNDVLNAPSVFLGPKQDLLDFIDFFRFEIVEHALVFFLKIGKTKEKML